MKASSLRYALPLALCLSTLALGGCSKVLPATWSSWIKEWPGDKDMTERQQAQDRLDLEAQQAQAELRKTQPETAFTRAKPYPVPPEPLLEEPETPGPLTEGDMAVDPDSRLARLEGRVEDLNGNIQRLVPALNELIASKGGQVPASAPAAPDTASASAAPVPIRASASPPASGGAVQALDVRFGEHPGKTRLVVDLSGPVQAQHSIDNPAKTMKIELPGVVWSGRAEGGAGKSRLVEGWSAAPSGQGSTLTLRLRAPVRALSQESIGPSGGRGHRLVLDLTSQ